MTSAVELTDIRAVLRAQRAMERATGGPDEHTLDVLNTDGAVPHFDLADRIRKSLRFAGIGVTELADFLGVSRGTVGNWINGRAVPNGATVRLIAVRSGVSFPWLLNGKNPHPENPGGGDSQEVRHQGLEPRTRWLAETAPYLRFCQSYSDPNRDRPAQIIEFPVGRRARDDATEARRSAS